MYVRFVRAKFTRNHDFMKGRQRRGSFRNVRSRATERPVNSRRHATSTIPSRFPGRLISVFSLKMRFVREAPTAQSKGSQQPATSSLHLRVSLACSISAPHMRGEVAAPTPVIHSCPAEKTGYPLYFTADDMAVYHGRFAVRARMYRGAAMQQRCHQCHPVVSASRLCFRCSYRFV